MEASVTTDCVVHELNDYQRHALGVFRSIAHPDGEYFPSDEELALSRRLLSGRSGDQAAFRARALAYFDHAILDDYEALLSRFDAPTALCIAVYEAEALFSYCLVQAGRMM